MTDRIRRHPLVRFTGVGGVATVVQLGLFAALSVVLPTVVANVFSWAVSTVGGNAMQRSVTFGVTRSAGALRDQVFSTALSLVGLLLSTVALDQVETSGTLAALAVVAVVNGAVGLIRFLALQWWFGPATAS